MDTEKVLNGTNINELKVLEIQVDNLGYKEFSYCPANNNPDIWLIKKELCYNIPGAYDELLYPHDMISYHKKDNINYMNDTCVVVFLGKPPLEICKKYNVPNLNFCDFYAIKYDLTNHTSSIKIYDRDLWKYPIPSLPAGSRICQQFGVGFHLDNRNNYDLYFLHNDRKTMRKFFKIQYPEISETFIPKTRQYGVCYDKDTLEIKKVKRYIYPFDLELNYPENI